MSGDPARTDTAEEAEGVARIRDKRRIDPVTGAVRQPASAPAGPAGAPESPGAPAGAPESPGAPAGAPGPAPAAGPGQDAGDPSAAALAERTADLQRLKAEYDNYRRRVERDRHLVGEQALASVLVGLLPVLDDIGRARAHGEVEGGFKLVADGLETTLSKLGLTPYGDPGEPFDPALHDALMHEYSDEVSRPTAVRIFEPGYRLGERVLRPARVAVAEPAADEAAPAAADEAAPEQAPEEAARGAEEDG